MIDFNDIDPFVLALSDPAGYHAAYPTCSYLLADINTDGQVSFADIDPFVLALSDPAGYHQQYPNCDIKLADINGDSTVKFADIDPFVALLGGQYGSRSNPPRHAGRGRARCAIVGSWSQLVDRHLLFFGSRVASCRVSHRRDADAPRKLKRDGLLGFAPAGRRCSPRIET